MERRLAISGGEPVFVEPLHVGRPNVGDRARLHRRLDGVLDRGWLTNHGPCEREFEARLAEHSGVRHCLAVANATLGLQMTMMALGVRGEVLMPAFTFIATPHAARLAGLTPVFCDVLPGCPQVDPADVARKITPRTSAILGVHVYGQCCDVDALAAIAREHDLGLIFDAAHAFGCSYGGRAVGGFGEAEVFSFHATKFANAFEGGAIATNNDALADRLRALRDFGIEASGRNVCLGMNAKLSEIHAAMGLTSLEAMDEIIAANRRNAQAYREDLADVPGIELIAPVDPQQQNAQYVVIRVREEEFGLSADTLQRVLRAENILARRYFSPGCHRLAPYAGDDGTAATPLPNTETLSRDVLALPTGTAVGSKQIDAIASLIHASRQRASQINMRGEE
ncbi:MAG: aminotransferase class I/II-fold pyridoxal phosphate-dependent enzyme [Planctomycetes bacterium]|nr:aminotransferase class I/II-fold pyridoxal phosphate-dependent enzyme [Phycisphaerae bacterium]NBB96416.1 aminotransferase class I/II-fold pyridoxal phosphate-dependent enzyme [Planctomycetota bacterium]